MGQSPSKNANSTSSLTTTNGQASGAGLGVISDEGGDDPSSSGCSGTSAHNKTPHHQKSSTTSSRPPTGRTRPSKSSTGGASRKERTSMSFDHDFSIDNASAADFMSKPKRRVSSGASKSAKTDGRRDQTGSERKSRRDKAEEAGLVAAMGEVVISRPHDSQSSSDTDNVSVASTDSEGSTSSLTAPAVAPIQNSNSEPGTAPGLHTEPISIPGNNDSLAHSKFLAAKRTPATTLPPPGSSGPVATPVIAVSHHDNNGSLTSNVTSEGSLSAISIASSSATSNASPENADKSKMSPQSSQSSSSSSEEDLSDISALKSPIPTTHIGSSRANAVALSSRPTASTPQRVDLPAGYQSSLSVSVDSVTGSPARNIKNPKVSGASVASTASSKRSTKQPLPFDVNDFIKRLLDAGGKSGGAAPVPLRPNEIVQLCAAARTVFMSQPVLLELGTPVKVVGDIHGQFGDLIRIFQMSGFPPKTNYLFLGDYVDRGRQSLETILLLFCFKVKYPENFFMLRGNHECASITKVYGFYDECKRRATTKIWKSFVDTFNTLPIAATIGGKIFCVHGGLSPYLNSMDDIRKITRPTNVPDVGLLSDLLWSDPERSIMEWSENDRGVSYCFGRSVVNKFCTKFKFDLVCRAHMVVQDGYEFFNKRKLVTVFSAPNYCGEFDNWGAVMCVSKQLLCSFELLKPMDSASIKDAVRRGIKKTQKVKLGES